MTTLTNEWLKTILKDSTDAGLGRSPLHNDEVINIIERLLAAEAQLAELDKQKPADFRWRYGADDHSGPSAWNYISCDRADEFIKRIGDKNKWIEYGYVFDSPVPQAVSQPYTIPGWSLNRAWEIDGLANMTPYQAHKAGYEQCRAAMLGKKQ